MRLIDADAIKLRYSFGMLDPDGVVCIPMKDVRKSIDAAPTIDAVPVVHCKDCRYYGSGIEPSHGATVRYCKLHTGLVLITKDTFCSYGERK